MITYVRKEQKLYLPPFSFLLYLFLESLSSLCNPNKKKHENLKSKAKRASKKNFEHLAQDSTKRRT